MNLFERISKSLTDNAERSAFCIGGKTYTYAQLAQMVSDIRFALTNETDIAEKHIGLVANTDIETYASIFALWLEGKAYVPMSPQTPLERNQSIIEQAALKTVIDSSISALFPNLKTIYSSNLEKGELNLDPVEVSDQETAFILFTSGTTGLPKGVPIRRFNVSSFVESFEDLGIEISHKDRCLQMFELTFDLSVMSYLLPILHGASVYLVPEDQIKYSYIYELMEDHNISVALMVPSILHYLRQYFNEINLPNMRYSLFCGEALPEDLTNEWSKCIPNAEIYNVYGPTEDTIFCTSYRFLRTEKNKSHNGILSIGKAMKGNLTVIVDDENKILGSGVVGQLCLAGNQLTLGYWGNEEKNKVSFFYTEFNGKQERFYKTGDLCFTDESGDILYSGRADFQTKIQGYRVELSEVEFHVKSLLQQKNIVAVAYMDILGNSDLGLAIEGEPFETVEILASLKGKVPFYMIPKKILFIAQFPLNVNGKTDRKEITKMIQSD